MKSQFLSVGEASVRSGEKVGLEAFVFADRTTRRGRGSRLEVVGPFIDTYEGHPKVGCSHVGTEGRITRNMDSPRSPDRACQKCES
ncbi:Hypothetical protein NTJ_01447 [Nesidiocoris tenuis]|uniref:Uncharacterized protein n=1 Tax=Nesidiocoris tenuis TaxID=355587 RepID=A0ABN7A8L3_9HEMI|nr:Hypothetical protein NTJ_01447 [Nesidiocoris tenuis]